MSNAMHGVPEMPHGFPAQRLGSVSQRGSRASPPDVTLCSRLLLHCRLSLQLVKKWGLAPPPYVYDRKITPTRVPVPIFSQALR